MQAEFKDYYKILGLNSSATQAEIRRAYRILARRYHPDLNPEKSSEDKFKSISEAYSILNDNDNRKKYDVEFDLRFNHASPGANSKSKTANKANTRVKKGPSAREKFYQQKFENFAKVKPQGYSASASKQNLKNQAVNTNSKPTNPLSASAFRKLGQQLLDKLSSITGKKISLSRPKHGAKNTGLTKGAPHSVSVIEMSITMADSIYGMKRTVEVEEPSGKRKISVNVPAGMRNGSVLRLRASGAKHEELILIFRVATHPYITLQPRGLVIEIPVSVQEAFAGATIKVPGIDESVLIRIPAGSQSGSEIRVKGHGIISRDNSRGDLFYRLLIKLPEEAVGLREKITEVEAYYGTALRQNLAETLLAF